MIEVKPYVILLHWPVTHSANVLLQNSLCAASIIRGVLCVFLHLVSFAFLSLNSAGEVVDGGTIAIFRITGYQ